MIIARKMDEEEKPVEKTKEEETKNKAAKTLLKILGTSAATYAIMATLLERKEIMEILARDDITMKEKAKLIAKEYLPEKKKEDLLEIGVAALTALVLAGKEKAKKEEKKEEDALKELIEALQKAEEEE